MQYAVPTNYMNYVANRVDAGDMYVCCINQNTTVAIQ